MISDDENDKFNIDDYKERIQSHIDYCAYDQPYEGGEVIWILGTQSTLDELFDEYDIPDDDELRDALANVLVCNGCGANLERYDDIGKKTEYEKKADSKWSEWHDLYQPKIENFGEFLKKYPYLGFEHDIGMEIISSITKFPTTAVVNEIWWKARKPIGAKRLKAKDMRPPAHSEAEGRFNHYGQSVFYLASTKEAALQEILDEEESIAWIQKFKIKKVENILDLSTLISADEDYPVLVFGLNMVLPWLAPDKMSPWKPEYFIPRFIADCAKYKEFNGIKFSSAKHYKDNLVLFNWDANCINSISKPIILELKKSPVGRAQPAESKVAR